MATINISAISGAQAKRMVLKLAPDAQLETLMGEYVVSWSDTCTASVWDNPADAWRDALVCLTEEVNRA